MKDPRRASTAQLRRKVVKIGVLSEEQAEKADRHEMIGILTTNYEEPTIGEALTALGEGLADVATQIEAVNEEESNVGEETLVEVDPTPPSTNGTPKRAKLTAEETRLKKNAGLRTWRAAHKSHVKAYMKGWRAKRDARAIEGTSIEELEEEVVVEGADGEEDDTE